MRGASAILPGHRLKLVYYSNGNTGSKKFAQNSLPQRMERVWRMKNAKLCVRGAPFGSHK